MSRTAEPKCKKCRREGEKLYLKGEKCLGPKCPVVRRSYAPGQHGPTSRKRLTPFGVQLREKQKAKRLYGLMEKQFSNYFKKASTKPGDTGVFLKQFLELRLDNVVYKLGLAKSRRMARQMISHGMFLVNGKLVNIPSYQVRPGDLLSIKETKDSKKVFTDIKERALKHETPAWLSLDPKEMKGKVLNRPSAEEVEQGFNSKLIIEFYSR